MEEPHDGQTYNKQTSKSQNIRITMTKFLMSTSVICTIQFPFTTVTWKRTGHIEKISKESEIYIHFDERTIDLCLL